MAKIVEPTAVVKIGKMGVFRADSGAHVSLSPIGLNGPFYMRKESVNFR